MSNVTRISYEARVAGIATVDGGGERVVLALHDVGADVTHDHPSRTPTLSFELDNLFEYAKDDQMRRGPKDDRTDEGDMEVLALLSPTRRVRITIEQIE